MPEAAAIFSASVKVHDRDGARISFWEDPWVDGQKIAALAPDLIKLVRPAARRSRTVKDGCRGSAWTGDITGELSVDAVVQYLRLWSLIQNATPGTGRDSFS
jgi:hypothetical protein